VIEERSSVPVASTAARSFTSVSALAMAGATDDGAAAAGIL
jgi:hypothetical protein